MRTVTRAENYCAATIQRLLETGTIQHRDVRGFHVSHGEGLTPNQNGFQALRMAAHDAADWIIFIEDDIDIIDDFIGSVERWLAKFATPEVLAYPLGSFYPTITPWHHERGAWDIPCDMYYGSQAVLFRTCDALDFARWAEQSGRDTEFDLHIAQWQEARTSSGARLLTPAPCFVDHVGVKSAMGSWERTGRMLDFPGRAWSYHG